jgi:hypothetical protein
MMKFKLFPSICKRFAIDRQKKPAKQAARPWRDPIRGSGKLFHQEGLAGAFDGAVQPPLIMGGETGVFAGENPPVVGDELFQEIDVLEIQGVNGEVNFGFRAGRADFCSAVLTRAVF